MIEAAIGAAAAGLAGQFIQGHQQRSSARQQMEFQRFMSDTAHQREVADLRAAGLNPILSVNRGASSPAGAGFQVPDYGSSVSSAIQANESLARADSERQWQRIRKPAETGAQGIDPYLKKGTEAVDAAVESARVVVGEVLDHVKPLGDKLSSAYETAVNKTTDVIESVANSPVVKGVIATAKGAKEVARRVVEGPKELYDRAGTQPKWSAKAIIPPANRGVRRGRMRGKLGGAETWDFEPSP